MSQPSPLGPALVALGAICGAWIRYGLVRGVSAWLRQRHWATWGVNMLACFLMGLVAGSQPRWPSPIRDTLVLALAVGFLGSLSTFSTLIAELVTTWQEQSKCQSVGLAAASLLGGFLACHLGLILAQGNP